MLGKNLHEDCTHLMALKTWLKLRFRKMVHHNVTAPNIRGAPGRLQESGFTGSGALCLDRSSGHVQAPAHTAVALASLLTSIMPARLDLERCASSPAEAWEALHRLLAAAGGSSEEQLDISERHADCNSVRLVIRGTQLSCEPLMRQLAGPQGSGNPVPSTASAVLETLAHLASLPIEGAPHSLNPEFVALCLSPKF